MTPAPLREDELISRLRAIVEEGGRGRVLLGIGDDAAVWQPSRSHRSVVTTDALVEGVHFTRETMSPYDAGWRTAVANLSDLAAMGARPVLATVALGVPAWASVDQLCECYCGLRDASAGAGLVIAGGDLTRAPVLTLAMTAIGEVRPSALARRSGGRAGDVVAVTGPLGASRAGLDAARGRVTLEAALAQEALAAHRRPQARVREGAWLARSLSVRAMMDCSDGLATDLQRLCAASGVGALIEHVPVAPAAAAAAAALGEDAERYALAGGEEFELIVAVRARAFSYTAARYRARFGMPLVAVGRLRKESGVAWAGRGEEHALPAGWDHFATPSV